MSNSLVKTIDLLIEASFYFVIAIPLLFYGGVEIWAKALIHYLVTLIFLLFALKSLIIGKVVLFGRRLTLPIVALLVSLAVSVLFSVYLNSSLRSFILFFDGIAIFLLFISGERTRRDFQRIIMMLVLIGIFQSLYAIYKPVFIPGAVKGSWYVTGSFYNHNHFAAFVELLFFIPLFVLALKKGLTPWKKYFYWGASIIFAISVVLALSRGALVSLILSFLILAIIRFKGRTRLAIVSSLFFCPL